MLRIHFTVEDLTRLRVMTSRGPVPETLFAMARLGRGGGGPLFDPWRQAVEHRLGHRVLAVRSLGRMVRPEPSHFLSEEPTRGGRGERILVGTGPRTEATAVMSAFYQSALAPYWRRICAYLEADRESRARIVLSCGIEGLLGSLHAQVRWTAPVLEVGQSGPPRPPQDIHLRGGGMLVVPSVFLACTPCVVFDRRDPEGIPVLVYPTPLDLRSAMRLWGSAGGSDGALGAVIGRTRANILGALSDSRTTTELGRMLGISAAAASQHTAILRDAGLITTRRRMNTVLHSLTPLSLALVKGKDFAFGGCCGRTGMTVAGPPKPRAVERGSPMPVLRVNDVVLNYRDSGSGEPVVLVMGSGGGGQAWHLYQVPALTAAGYRVVTFDNRGIPPSSEGPDGFIVRDLVADTAGLIERLGAAPCHLVGTSMGAYVAQELALARPELVRRVVLMATHGRCDAVRTALARAEVELADSGVCLTAGYRAVVQALQSLSPQTLNDDKQMVDWLDLFELAQRGGPGVRSQLRLSPMPDRLAAYRGIRVPCHVIAFADDLVTPPYLGREVAEAIPGAGYEVLAGCGHYGYLEQPDAVNASILRFLRG